MSNFTPVAAAIGGAMIGLSTVLLMVLVGRIAGISGITAGLLRLDTKDRGWRLAFLAGLIAAPILAALIGHPMPAPPMPASLAVIVASGLLIGFGTRLGGMHIRSRH